jgi:hypothetical protein
MSLKSKEFISELSGKIGAIIIINTSILGRINVLEYFQSQNPFWVSFDITQSRMGMMTSQSLSQCS